MHEHLTLLNSETNARYALLASLHSETNALSTVELDENFP